MFCKKSDLFSRIIIIGTGLLTVIVKDAVSSVSVRFREKEGVAIFTDTGLFLNTEPSQEKYVQKYLNLSNSASDAHLMEHNVYCIGSLGGKSICQNFFVDSCHVKL